MTATRKKPNNEGGVFASPPCFLHELDETRGGVPPTPNAQQSRDVAHWRKAERSRLLEDRARLSVSVSAEAAAAIAGHLDRLVGDISGLVVSVYWPIKSEMDLRPWMATLAARGARAALPVVRRQASPLAFRAWHEGSRMERGIWNIPVPAEGDWLVPDIVIAPLVGFDSACFRLGYGGGYFDRTLASQGKAVRPIGIGLVSSHIETIYPQPHDIAMTAIVTEVGVAGMRPD